MENRVRAPRFLQFIVSGPGRVLRMLIGIVMIWGGLAAATPLGYLIAVLGLAPLGAGVFDLCLTGPLFGVPVSGQKVRERVARPAAEKKIRRIA